MTEQLSKPSHQGGAEPAAEMVLCQNGCGFVERSLLVPDDNDPPGLCPHCSGQTCDCNHCLAHTEYEPLSPVGQASPVEQPNWFAMGASVFAISLLGYWTTKDASTALPAARAVALIGLGGMIIGPVVAACGLILDRPVSGAPSARSDGK